MKICVCGPFLLLLLLFLCGAVAGLGSVVVKSYELVRRPSTWLSAQRYCRRKFIDLGTIFTKSDEETDLESYFVWINLHKEGNDWVWSDGETSNHIDWAKDEPDSSDNCAVVSYRSRKILGSNCGEYAFFFCYEEDRYVFVPQSKTMTEAKAYCRTEHRVLANFGKGERFESHLKEQDYPVWTGLHREGGTWHWSYGSYRNWASAEPNAQGNCVAISSQDKEMSTRDCSARFPFICLSTYLVLVKENKTWEEALDYCRALGSPAGDELQHELQYDLLSVQPGDQYVTTAVQKADSEEVWLGLRFLAGSWLWVNGATLLYPDLPVCPPPLQHCGALPRSSASGDGFVLSDCAERKNFLCYRKH